MELKEIYQGFPEEQIPEIRNEVSQKWGHDKLRESENNIKRMGKDGLQKVKNEGEAICHELALLMGLPPNNIKVQEAISKKHKNLNNYYEVTPQVFRGLGNMYVQDPRFTAYYEKYAKGLAAFVQQAIEVYCDKLEVKN